MALKKILFSKVKYVFVKVRASELIRSSSFGTDYTLRFPRVEQVRDDKPVQDVMKLKEFNEISAVSIS